ncbi:hypothetical protein B0T21DRAFT_444459 [Apiosordaria backusii]|uniref:Uncharacterized protein n=1 Tax=Apiosordaria backusii TaxID=314023 RepID=A0AA40B757_9PEZI|nr:hypothetical protein B0T21DRAFT_444459 [Apiosordaria backusii]
MAATILRSDIKEHSHQSKMLAQRLRDPATLDPSSSEELQATSRMGIPSWLPVRRGLSKDEWYRQHEQLPVRVLASLKEATPGDNDGDVVLEDGNNHSTRPQPEDPRVADASLLVHFVVESLTRVERDVVDALVSMRHGPQGSLPVKPLVPVALDDDPDATEDEDSAPDRPAPIPDPPTPDSGERSPNSPLADNGRQSPGGSSSGGISDGSSSDSLRSTTSGSSSAPPKKCTKKYMNELAAAEKINAEGDLLEGDEQCEQCQNFARNTKQGTRRQAITRNHTTVYGEHSNFTLFCRKKVEQIMDLGLLC